MEEYRESSGWAALLAQMGRTDWSWLLALDRDALEPVPAMLHCLVTACSAHGWSATVSALNSLEAWVEVEVWQPKEDGSGRRMLLIMRVGLLRPDAQPALLLGHTELDGIAPIPAYCEIWTLWQAIIRENETLLPRISPIESFGLVPDDRVEGRLPRPKAGRRPDENDRWAYVEVNGRGRKPDEVYAEWLRRIGERAHSLADPRDSFRKAIKRKQNRRSGRNKEE